MGRINGHAYHQRSGRHVSGNAEKADLPDCLRKQEQWGRWQLDKKSGQNDFLFGESANRQTLNSLTVESSWRRLVQLHRGFCMPVFLLLSSIFLLTSTGSSAQTPQEGTVPTQIPGRDAILMGTDWYTEQWPATRWGPHVRMMEAAHIKVVRIAEFAWSRMEPSEGQFDFAWLNRTIRLAEKHHIA